jgi:hypothetical protein
MWNKIYRGAQFIPAIDLQVWVIAALSDCDSNHLWTDARFIEKPVKPPLVFESRLTVCSIVWSQATAEKP